MFCFSFDVTFLQQKASDLREGVMIEKQLPRVPEAKAVLTLGRTDPDVPCGPSLPVRELPPLLG